MMSDILFAQNDPQDQLQNEIKAQEISDEIMSPYCPGRTLSACPSDDARKLRQRITSQLNQGYSTDAVKRQLVGMFGKEILGKPSMNGFGLIAWFLPFLILFLSFFLIFRIIKKNYKKRDIENKIESDLESIENSLYMKIKK